MERGRRSVFRHSGLAQAGEIGLLEQCANLRRPGVLGGLQAGDGRVGVSAEGAGFGEFAAEALGPQMRVDFRVDQLGVIR